MAPHKLAPRSTLYVLCTPRITRGTDAMTLPLVESSFLAMWCSMSLFFLFPPPPLPLPPRSLTSPLCFPLTRWSSHLCRCFLQVLLRCATARRSPVTPQGRYPARASRGHLPDRSLRTTRVRLRPLRHASSSRYASTSDMSGWSRYRRRHRWWPPHRQGRLRHRRGLPRRRHRHRRRGPQLLMSRCRCTTHRFFTDTRVMFTLW